MYVLLILHYCCYNCRNSRYKYIVIVDYRKKRRYYLKQTGVLYGDIFFFIVSKREYWNYIYRLHTVTNVRHFTSHSAYSVSFNQ